MDISLEQRWQALAEQFSQDETFIGESFGQIKQRYSEPHRLHHTFTHLQNLFADIDALALVNPQTEMQRIAFAIWFHDIIYKPGSKKNEKFSADFAVHVMGQLGCAIDDVNKVVYMIECTKKHSNPRDDCETQWFLDADMAILGAPDKVYRKYMRSVRKEFKSTPGLLYRHGRKRFIRATLEQQRIYGSEAFFDKYETQARLNLTMELGKLQGVEDT